MNRATPQDAPALRPTGRRAAAYHLAAALGRKLAMAVPLVFLTLCFFYPLGTILWRAFADGMSGLRETLSTGYTWQTLWFTLWQAALSTGLTLAAGLPGAYLFARYRFPGKQLLQAIAAVPFVMPTVVVAAALGALLGPRGLLNLLLIDWLALERPPIRVRNGLGLVLLAHVFYNYTVVLRLVGGLWSRLDPRLEAAAAMLGANRLRVFLRVTLPLLAPAIGAAALLIFIFTFTSFGVIVILGGPRLATIEVEIYRQVAQLLRLDLAASLALLQLVCTLALSMTYTHLAARVRFPLELQPQLAVARPPANLTARLLVWGNSLFILLLLAMPLAALVLRSLLTGEDGGWSLNAYLALNRNPTGSAFFVAPGDAISNSLRIAAITTLLSLAIGVPAAYLLAGAPAPAAGRSGRQGRSSILDALFMLPLGASATTLGLGLLLALSVPNLAPLRTSPWLIPLLHSLVALPFVIRALLPLLQTRNRQLNEAAAMLGASPGRVWLRVELPLIAPALVTGAIFAFTVSLGEFGATLLIARPDAPTLPVLIFRLLGLPGALNYAQALAASSILMLITMLSFLLLERIRPPGGTF